MGIVAKIIYCKNNFDPVHIHFANLYPGIKICFSEPTAGEEVFAPRFVEKLQPKHVPDGATVQFECQVEGNPHPQITWFRQTAIIKPSQDFQVSLLFAVY